MKDRWSELARRARSAPRTDSPAMPFGFADAVMHRLARAGRDNPADAWLPLLRPAVGLAFATAILCVVLQTRAQQNDLPESLLVETENMIRLAVLE